MGRTPCCDKQLGLKKGPWTPEEDKVLVDYIQANGHGSWRSLPKLAGQFSSLSLSQSSCFSFIFCKFLIWVLSVFFLPKLSLPQAQVLCMGKYG